jgi:molybdate transport system substrate-binding protein
MPAAITGISSMATRQVLADLAAAYARSSGVDVAIESVGGVDAARRVQAGEAFDHVILAADAIERLTTAGAVVAGSRVDLMRSPVAIAVRAGAPRPEVGSEEAVRAALRAARRIGLSTGPSGNQLMRLFERWGLASELAGRVLQAPPGVPVGRLVASGECEIGLQQWSELIHEPGIEVLGLLPPPIGVVTTFSAGLCVAGTQPEAVRAWLAFAASADAAVARRRHGMEPPP